jgi:hypothetical protein
MGVVSRYFERLAEMRRGRRAAAAAVSADTEGLRIGGERVAWSDVRRLDAYKRDIYVGDLLCLAILATGDRVFEINEESPGWKESADAIERFLPGSLPHAEWTLRLIAAKPDGSVPIYPGDLRREKSTGSTQIPPR